MAGGFVVGAVPIGLLSLGPLRRPERANLLACLEIAGMAAPGYPRRLAFWLTLRAFRDSVRASSCQSA